MIVDRNNLREVFAEYFKVKSLSASIEIRLIDLETMTRNKKFEITALERNIAALKKEIAEMELEADDFQEKLQKVKAYQESLSEEIIDKTFKSMKEVKENGKCRNAKDTLSRQKV